MHTEKKAFYAVVCSNIAQSDPQVTVHPIELLIPKIMNQYNKQPAGWTVLTDPKGNVLVLGPSKGYMLKTLHLNPQEYTGVRTEIEDAGDLRRIVELGPSYGFRPLSERQSEELVRSFSQRDKQNRLNSQLLRKKPVPTWELEKKKPSTVISGPIIAHPNLSAISKSQRELELKLKSEVDKLFRKKYPNRAAIYG